MSIVDEICDRQTNGCLQQPAKRAEEVNSCEGPAGGLSADRLTEEKKGKFRREKEDEAEGGTVHGD